MLLFWLRLLDHVVARDRKRLTQRDLTQRELRQGAYLRGLYLMAQLYRAIEVSTAQPLESYFEPQQSEACAHPYEYLTSRFAGDGPIGFPLARQLRRVQRVDGGFYVGEPPL